MARAGAAEQALGAVSLLAKDFEFTYPFVVKASVTVAPNVTLDAWTTRDSGNAAADPGLVGFFCYGGVVNACRSQAVGLNDDYNGQLDARIRWKNTTGANRNVVLYAFAHSEATGGVVSLKWRLTTTILGPIQTATGPARAVAVNTSAPRKTNCDQPLSSTFIPWPWRWLCRPAPSMPCSLCAEMEVEAVDV